MTDKKQDTVATGKCECTGSDLIEVAVLVFPTGTTSWIVNPTQDKIEQEFDKFRHIHGKLYGTGVTSGCVQILMQKDFYPNTQNQAE